MAIHLLECMYTYNAYITHTKTASGGGDGYTIKLFYRVYGDVYMLDDKMKWHTLPPIPKPDSHIEAS
ncbi:hypothetical protein HanPI659440_Chr03g0117111 [Helianthus annuus]|nr:hypothetical protein HanPI659440_Chr03g0117111 [Helianthus annuus]